MNTQQIPNVSEGELPYCPFSSKASAPYGSCGLRHKEFQTLRCFVDLTASHMLQDIQLHQVTASLI